MLVAWRQVVWVEKEIFVFSSSHFCVIACKHIRHCRENIKLILLPNKRQHSHKNMKNGKFYGRNEIVPYFWENICGIGTLHCKKRLEIFPSLAGMSPTKFSLAGNNLFITGQGEFGTGQSLTFFTVWRFCAATFSRNYFLTIFDTFSRKWMKTYKWWGRKERELPARGGCGRAPGRPRKLRPCRCPCKSESIEWCIEEQA